MKKSKTSKKVQGTNDPSRLKVSSSDAYAYGTPDTKGSDTLKGSQTGFLGKEDQLLDPREFVARDKLNVKKRK